LGDYHFHVVHTADAVAIGAINCYHYIFRLRCAGDQPWLL